jgi:UDPglucose--hexose-1-phosphate uridylyltransferase
LLVSPDRTRRPWQGKVESKSDIQVPEYLEDCYLCPGNVRANGETNPTYTSTFVFNNDFSSLHADGTKLEINESELIKAKSERGICRVVCFSPKHNLTLAELDLEDIVKVVTTWQDEYLNLGSKSFIKYVQIFENKGEIMGCSNPHPHGQIWAQETIPNEPAKEQHNQLKYYQKRNSTLLSDYLKLELQKGERIIQENDGFILLVPFWAFWPFETIIISKRKISNILQLNEAEVIQFAEILKDLTVRYDNIFKLPFPYSAGIHQAPADGLVYPEWHFHMHFYPPLLRSATVKKFMVGYEMLAEPQRDITPERSAEILRQQDTIHYSLKIKNDG